MIEYGIDNYFNLIIQNFNSSAQQIKECQAYMFDLFNNQIIPGDFCALIFDDVVDKVDNNIVVTKKSIHSLKLTNDKFFVYFDNIFLSRKENILSIEFYSNFITNYIFYSIKIFKRNEYESTIKLRVLRKDY
jgi:hypothetical protein